MKKNANKTWIKKNLNHRGIQATKLNGKYTPTWYTCNSTIDFMWFIECNSNTEYEWLFWNKKRVTNHETCQTFALISHCFCLLSNYFSFRSLCTDLDLDSPIIVQEFIENPFLIDGYKFNMGAYVLITSINPLRAYIFHSEISIRFCRYPYTKGNYSDAVTYVTDIHGPKKREYEVRNDGQKRPHLHAAGLKLAPILHWT